MDKWERLGSAVVDRRVELGMSQAEAAERAQLGTATWSLIENAGRTSYKPLTYRSIERALDWAPGTVERILASARFSPEPDPRPSRDEVLERLDRMERAIREEAQALREQVEELVNRSRYEPNSEPRR